MLMNKDVSIRQKIKIKTFLLYKAKLTHFLKKKIIIIIINNNNNNNKINSKNKITHPTT